MIVIIFRINIEFNIKSITYVKETFPGNHVTETKELFDNDVFFSMRTRNEHDEWNMYNIFKILKIKLNMLSVEFNEEKFEVIFKIL